MSSTNFATDSTNAFTSQPPPSHHIHHDADALPGTRGETSAPNYDTSVTNDPSTWTERNQQHPDTGTDSNRVAAGGQHDASHDKSGSPKGRSAFSEERPLNVQPTSQGEVAVGGQNDLPQGQAKFIDKVIGKTEKVAGKAFRNPELHEKGELREAGGKQAALGQARAPHD